MKFLPTIMGAAVASGVSAQTAVVENDCTSLIYVQSFPFDGSAASTLTTLARGESFREDFRPSGSTIKIATTRTLNNPLFFGYSFSSNPDFAYYELSTEFGNPFSTFRNILSPGPGCEFFDCAANDTECYSTPAMKKVYGCPQPVNLQANICA